MTSKYGRMNPADDVYRERFLDGLYADMALKKIRKAKREEKARLEILAAAERS